MVSPTKTNCPRPPATPATPTTAAAAVVSSKNDDNNSRNELKPAPVDQLMFYGSDVFLALLGGVLPALFNLLIGRYVTVSVAHNGNPEHFPLVQCIVHFLCAGTALPLVSFLHHVSMNQRQNNSKSLLYRNALGIFMRDSVYLVTSICISLSLSWTLAIPVLLVPIMVFVWTISLQNQKSPILKGLCLAGPVLLFFLNMSLGGLYGTALVDLRQLDELGAIFTIVVGIGSSAIQFVKARAQLQQLLQRQNGQHIHAKDENLNKMENGQRKQSAVEDKCQENGRQRINETGIYPNELGGQNSAMEEVPKGDNGRGATKREKQLVLQWARIQLRLFCRCPLLYAVGLLVCLTHAFSYPVFARLTGMFFSVFEHNRGKTDSLLDHVEWICIAYAAMGFIAFAAIVNWNAIFGRMGVRLREELVEKTKNDENPMAVKLMNWQRIETIPLFSCEFFYGLFSVFIAIASSLQNNLQMGLFAVCVFCGQVLAQQLACQCLRHSKMGRAIGFASTNGMQQFSQAIAYAGGFVLVQLKIVTALNVFKIIQTMHLSSVGLTSIVLFSNDFAEGSRELDKAWAKWGGPAAGDHIIPVKEKKIAIIS